MITVLCIALTLLVAVAAGWPTYRQERRDAEQFARRIADAPALWIPPTDAPPRPELPPSSARHRRTTTNPRSTR